MSISTPKITRVAAQATGDTTSIPYISSIIDKYISEPSIDPFARNSQLCKVTNDMNPETNAMFNMEAEAFLQQYEDESFSFAIFDPPYSPRQIKELYDGIGLKLTQEQTQSTQWSIWGEQVGRILNVNGVCVKLSWNSCRPFKNARLLEMMCVCHGGMHNDTIITVWEKTQHQHSFF